MKIRLRTSRRSPPQVVHDCQTLQPIFTHVGPIELEVQPNGAIHAIAQDLDCVRTYVVTPEDAVEFARAILAAAEPSDLR